MLAFSVQYLVAENHFYVIISSASTNEIILIFPLSWYQGIKIAIFDVTDVKNPKEKFVEIIGNRGTDSELLRNHKARMFMKGLGLTAFPITVAENHEGAWGGSFCSYGEFVYQGAYVYNISIYILFNKMLRWL